MCGFSGFLYNSNTPSNSEGLLLLMGRAIKHRGPDDEGIWQDELNGIGLVHRRLAILDISPAGHQPMESPSGRFVVVFNGEIYNYLDLRIIIENEEGMYNWKGHSDTEVLLAGFDVWGIQTTIERTVGMFAFAVWDRETRTLTLGRDRIGEKPLYYGWQGNTFLFGSELKALKVHPSFEPEINRGAVSLLLRHNCIPAPYSVYQGIHKLMPGCILQVSRARPDPKVIVYWSAVTVAHEGASKPFTGSADEAVDELERLAKEAVKQQMVADVPLGAFLSGGIDSSTVVALMQAQSRLPVKTYSIGLSEVGYNEAAHAKAVAKHLGTEHTELYIRPREALEVIPLLSTLYDEPFSDSSQIPTFLVSRLAKQDVTVSLSGDAGDELFCGYNRYYMTAKFWHKLERLPIRLRNGIANCISSVSPKVWDRLYRYVPGSGKYANFGDKLHKGARVITSITLDDLYLRLVSHYLSPSDLVIDGQEPPTLLTGNMPDLNGLSNLQRMMVMDQVTYLPDDILVKVDRAAMAVSLETRVPFLDHRIIEFASSLPLSLKMRNAVTKWPLRQVLYRYVPRELMDRPKRGFAIPLGDWLRGPLRGWAETLLAENRLREESIFCPGRIRKLWSEHLNGNYNLAYLLWDVLIFQSWLEAQ